MRIYPLIVFVKLIYLCKISSCRIHAHVFRPISHPLKTTLRYLYHSHETFRAPHLPHPILENCGTVHVPARCARLVGATLHDQRCSFVIVTQMHAANLSHQINRVVQLHRFITLQLPKMLSLQVSDWQWSRTGISHSSLQDHSANQICTQYPSR